MRFQKEIAIAFARFVDPKYKPLPEFKSLDQTVGFAMPDFMNSVKTINSAVRTVLVVGAFGVVGYGGWFGYTNYVQPSAEAKQAIADLENLKLEFEQQEVALKKTKKLNERLETSMKLLKVDRRMANVTVMEKGVDEEGNPYLEVSFTEVNDQDQPVGTTRNYTLKGEKFYIDGWVATFDDKYIEAADELRAASMFSFKSIYGDAEAPKNGQRLDVESNDGGVPGIYKDDRKREFEQQIWSDFWKVCNDPDLQHELGIRTSGGRTSYIEAIEGKTYKVNIRATGDMSLQPIIEP